MIKTLGRELVAWVKRHLTLLKVLFVLSVLVFVAFEVGRIGNELNGETMRESLATQSPLTLALLMVLGLIAVLPMLNYDFTIAAMLPGDFKPLYVVKSGWIVNAFTNIAGFGGFLGASLRANFYHKGASQKEILAAIAKIALFLLAGLSLWSLIALVLIFAFGVGRMYTDYWLWLIGGAAYFPVLMAVTHLTNKAFFADLPLKRQLGLTLGSFLEWGGCAGFFLIIGAFLQVPTALLNLLPLFLIANVLGVLSMVPGGLGTFDVFMIFGLGQMGVDPSVAVVWLLLYRLFYYVIPFLIAVVLFVQDAGRQLNATLEGLPMQLLRKVAHGFVVVFMYFSAMMLLLRGVIPDLAMRNHFFMQLYPYTFIFISRVTNVIMAFAIFGFARGMANRVHRAFWPTMVILVAATIASIRQAASLKFDLLLLLVLVALVLARKELTRTRMDFPWGSRLVDGVVFGLTALFYAFALYYNAPALRHPRRIPQVFLFPSERTWFMMLVGVLMAAVTVAVIYHYLSTPQTPLSTPYDEARLRAIIAAYGGNEVSHLAFIGDKAVRIYQVDGEDKVFFMYQKKTDKLIILGEPVGDQDYVLAAVADFMQAADKQDLSLVFYEISEALTMQLHTYGFDFMKFGEEGYVDLTNFTLAGTKRKGERALIHKFEREGYQFEWLTPPFDAQLLLQLQAVSDEWLGGRPEKGFSLGYFDRQYLSAAPIGVLKDASGQIVSFATAMPMGTTAATSIDLMRSSEAAPSGIMDGIFINLFQKAQEDGYQWFNMGMAPLANVGVSDYSFLEEKMAHLVYEYGYRFYGFQGLRSYKSKYVTRWVPKYVAYRKRSSLLFTLLQILLVVNRKRGVTAQPNFWMRRLGWLSRLGEFAARSDK